MPLASSRTPPIPYHPQLMPSPPSRERCGNGLVPQSYPCCSRALFEEGCVIYIYKPARQTPLDNTRVEFYRADESFIHEKLFLFWLLSFFVVVKDNRSEVSEGMSSVFLPLLVLDGTLCARRTGQGQS
jgi:hypothetical protein